MSVQKKKIEGGSVLRIQACKETIALQLESPLQYGILHTNYSVLLCIEDAKTVRDFLTKAINEIEKK